MILNGIQSSPSCHSTVPFASVSFPLIVAFAIVSLIAWGDVEFKVRVSVNGTAEDWPEPWGMNEVMVVVSTVWLVLADPEDDGRGVEDAEDGLGPDEDGS